MSSSLASPPNTSEELITPAVGGLASSFTVNCTYCVWPTISLPTAQRTALVPAGKGFAADSAQPSVVALPVTTFKVPLATAGPADMSPMREPA